MKMKSDRLHLRSSHRSGRPRRGAVLIVALLITAVLGIMVLSLGRSMRVELQAASNQSSAEQAMAVERGAEQYLMGLLASDNGSIQDLTEDQFTDISIGSGLFRVVRPQYDDDTLPVFGLVEENSKININKAGTTLLENIFQDDDTIDAITAWRNPNGPGDSYYQSLPNPYQCKQDPFETVEELLMVRNFTREMIWGDGTAPPLGQQTSVIGSPSSTDGTLSDTQISRGVYDLFTATTDTYPTVGPDGQTNLVQLTSQSGIRNLLRTEVSNGAASRLFRRAIPTTARRPTSLSFSRAASSATPTWTISPITSSRRQRNWPTA